MADSIVTELVVRIKQNITKITKNYEIILVEDGSVDNSWKMITEVCEFNPEVIGIKLTRNFGQHYAIAAGIEQAQGDYVIVMDCDLQDNPKYFKKIYQKSQEGFDVVFTIKKNRNHGFIKNFMANRFHKFFNWLVGNQVYQSDKLIGSYSLISRKVVNSYNMIKDYHKPYLVIIQWLGFKPAYINVEHEERYQGKSSYTFRKLISHAINGIVSQTDRLLYLIITFGFSMSLVGFILTGLIIFQAITKGFQSGWASTMVVIITSTGLILSSSGIIGVYVGKIFMQVKDRPNFIIDEKINAQ